MELSVNMRRILQSVAVILGLVIIINADLSGIVDICCEEGAEWAQSNTRCDNYPTAVYGVDNRDQALCRTVLEVCCLKSKQEQMCAQGKSDATDTGYTSCAIRDDVLGAVMYKECCHCCNMGLIARSMGMECSAPPIGNPCDLKFIECCTGITDEVTQRPSNYTHRESDVSDIDECTVFGEQLCSQICINTIGSFRCECRQGFILAQDERTCIRRSETCAGGHECSHNCIDTSRGPVCTCREGYRLLHDRKSCTDIDECRRGMSNCREDETCVNTEGGFQCQPADEPIPNCRQGYIYDQSRGACIPGHEVTDRCPQGYAYNARTEVCEDIDECTVRLDNCYGSFEVCENTYGSFSCSCKEGFMRNRLGQCRDIDECARRIDTCTSSQRCENTEGSFVCRRLTGCGTGYTLDEETQECIDQDECESGTHNCRRGYECINIEGSFRCIPRGCPEGYTVNSRTGQCERVDCPTGLRASGASICVDIDECSEQPGICQSYQTCENSYGSYRCIDPIDCRPGYEMDQNGQFCVDIDECAKGTHDCQGGATCINRQGSYTCTCPEGYRRINGICQDKDECQYGNVCPFNSVCENTEGSFTCVCNPGLEKRGRQCVDIDECQEANRCQHRCVNVIGSYHCTCDTGYQLAADGRTCEDIDECRQFAGRGSICIGNCINLPGSYRCTCPDGWRLLGNGRSCQDIDECAEGLDRCGQDPDVMCFNTRGSHKCPRITCPPGFTRSQLGPRGNSDVVVESDDILCVKNCKPYDVHCVHNKTTSVSFQFLSLPIIPKIYWPVVLLNITAQGFALVPQMYLYIFSGNEYGLFDTKVEGDTATFRLVKPLLGPAEHHVMLRLENRSYVGNRLLSAHNTHIFIDVSSLVEQS